jgi:dienelactone hydrolase
MPISSHVFPNGDVLLAAHVHRPEGDPFVRRPAVVVMGSWLTVKEQMADLYAAALAERGYLAVTFDFSGFGASGGTLRQTEMPTRKIADITAAIRWVSSLSAAAPGGVGVTAVCASAQYTLAALAAGAPGRSFASVAGWFHDTASVAPFYGGPEGVTARIDRAQVATEEYLRTGTAPVVPAYASGDETAGMFLDMDYYANPERGAIPSWHNAMTEITWAHWLTFDGLAAAPSVDAPTLFVHSDGCVFPDHVRMLAKTVAGPVTTAWGEGEQTDFYDRPPQTAFAIDALDAHFRATLGVPDR